MNELLIIRPLVLTISVHAGEIVGTSSMEVIHRLEQYGSETGELTVHRIFVYESGLC